MKWLHMGWNGGQAKGVKGNRQIDIIHHVMHGFMTRSKKTSRLFASMVGFWKDINN